MPMRNNRKRLIDIFYDYIILINLGMFQAKDGLKFSFGLRSREENPSAFSTPKFPSIQVSKDSNCNPFYVQNKAKAATERIEIKKSPSQIYNELGGGGIELIKRDKKLKLKINDKYVPFMSGDVSSVDRSQVKSVKSAHLSNDKDIYRSEKKKDRKYYKNKNFHSLANILELRPQFQRSKFQTRAGKSNLSIKNQQQVQTKGKILRSKIKDVLVKPERKDTKKVVNNFFEVNPSNIEMRQTKKEHRSSEKQQSKQKEKSRIFKSYLQKARPTLRIAGRFLNNDRLQTIVKDYTSEYSNF